MKSESEMPGLNLVAWESEGLSDVVLIVTASVNDLEETAGIPLPVTDVRSTHAIALRPSSTSVQVLKVTLISEMS